jgi:hypothetical protein
MFSRAIPSSVAKSLASFLSSCSNKSDTVNERHARASSLVKDVKEATVTLASSSGKATSFGLRLGADGVNELSKRPQESVVVAKSSVILVELNLKTICVSCCFCPVLFFFLFFSFFFSCFKKFDVLLGVLFVLESLEQASVETILKQISSVKHSSSSVSDVVELLRARRSNLQDDAAREILAKLAFRLEQESTSGSKESLSRTLQVAVSHMQALLRPFTASLNDKAWFDPRAARTAAHSVAAAAVQGQGRELVERGRGLATLVAEIGDVDAEKMAGLKSLTAKLLALARAHISSGAEKAGMAEICRQLYSAFADVATLQHQVMQAYLVKHHLAKGELVSTLLRLHLVAIGSDAFSTTSQLHYFWPAKKRTSQQQHMSTGGNSATTNGAHHLPPVLVNSAAARGGAADAKLPFLGSCCVCKEDIRGRIMKALNGMYHPEHFSCTGCARVIAVHESFMADPSHPLRPVCTACSSKALAHASLTVRPMQPAAGNHGPCAKCGRAVVGDHVTAVGKMFHPSCLQCGSCSRIMNATEKLTKGENGFLICSSCAAPSTVLATPKKVASSVKQMVVPRFSRRMCSTCKGEVAEGNVLMDGSEFFHRECFNCGECKQALGADFFLSGGKRLCRECYKFSMYKCFACMLPLHKHGSDVQHGGHMFHLSCAPRGVVASPASAPSKPLPLPEDVSPSSSPPPSPPPSRPRWSRNEDSSIHPVSAPAPRWSQHDIEDEEVIAPSSTEADLDDLMNEFMTRDEEEPAAIPLQTPLMRTSRSSRASGARVEACWSCGEPNNIDYILCSACGEPGLVGGEVELPEHGEVFDGMSRRSVADEDQLSALILELGDI